MKAPRFIVLSGGVGGARFAAGMQAALPEPEDLAVIVNTGDDFDHLGLRIMPDVDTMLYTLADLENRAQGWGRRDETRNFMAATEQLGGPGWFMLGDRDLALHVHRTEALRRGVTPTALVEEVAARFGIGAQVRPMTDQPVATRVSTDEGELDFQDYFVRRRCAPIVRSLRFAGIDVAQPSAAVAAALRSDRLEAIFIAPSNPYLSVDPILHLPGLRDLIRAAAVPVVAISPVIAGGAIKGPAAKMMAEMGLTPSARTVAAHYEGLIDGFVLDAQDQALAEAIALPTLVTDTIMRDQATRRRLAEACIAFATEIATR